MSTKLTLSLDKEVIEQAKVYAKEKQVSLSFLVENYLQKIVSEYQSKPDTGGSIVDELAGIVRLPTDLDYQEEHATYLLEKHK